MSRISTPNLDVLKRPRVLIAIGIVVVLVIVFYLAWWSPESSKLSSVDAEQTAKTQQISTLQLHLKQIQQDNAIVRNDQAYLGIFASAIPAQPEQGQLIYLLGQLERADGVDVTSINASTTAPPAVGSALSTIPITLTLTGSHTSVLKFVSGLYTMPRLVTIQSFTPSAAGGSASGNVLGKDNVPFTLSISATAYFTAPVAATPATP